MRFRVGVDGGGTTTRAVVINERGATVGRAQSGSSNLYNLGLEAAVANVRAAIEGALEQARIGVGEVESFGFALAGATGEAQKKLWREALRPLYGAAITVDEDVAGALAGALGEDGLSQDGLSQGGAVLIAGTGANCFGQDGHGHRRRADGWGPLLGDRGSGYWLGEAAIRAALAAQDGAAPATLLADALLKYFEAESLEALVGVVYAADFRRDRVAGFVPHILVAARAGDETARGLLRQSGALLGATARAVLEPLAVKRLALTGGLLEHSPEVRAALAESLPGVELCEPRFEAVVGAAFLPALEKTR
jgi:N-acetylglucosamine kinase-like BadF-type ATPase